MAMIQDGCMDEFLLSVEEDNVFARITYKEGEIYHRPTKKLAFRHISKTETKSIRGDANLVCLSEFLGIPVYTEKQRPDVDYLYKEGQEHIDYEVEANKFASTLMPGIIDKFLANDLPEGCVENIYDQLITWSKTYQTKKSSEAKIKEAVRDCKSLEELKSLGKDVLYAAGRLFIVHFSRTRTGYNVPFVMVGACSAYGSYQKGSLPDVTEDGGIAQGKYQAVYYVVDEYQKYKFKKSPQGKQYQEGTSEFKKAYKQYLRQPNANNEIWARMDKQGIVYQLSCKCDERAEADEAAEDGKIYYKEGVFDTKKFQSDKLLQGLNSGIAHDNPGFADIVVSYLSGKTKAECGLNMTVSTWAGEETVSEEAWYKFDQKIYDDIHKKKIRQFRDFKLDENIEKVGRLLNSDPDKEWLTPEIMQKNPTGCMLLGLEIKTNDADKIINEAINQAQQAATPGTTPAAVPSGAVPNIPM